MKLLIKVWKNGLFTKFIDRDNVSVSVLTSDSYIRRSTVSRNSKNIYIATLVDKYYLVETARYNSFGKAQEYIQSEYDKHKDDIPNVRE